MADLCDVEQALADCITNLLYPEGATLPSIIGATCRVYRGWPNAAALSSDLNAGVVNITIASDDHSGTTTSRYLREWQTIQVLPTLTASVSDNIISFDGTASAGTVVGALLDGAAYVYRVEAGETPDLVAANLCARIQADFIASAHGPRIEVQTADSILIRIVSDASATCEGRRQEKDVRVICWCPTPTLRDSLASSIDMTLLQSSFILLSDKSRARLTYRNTTTSDRSQNALLYRRDLIYCIEYPTIISVDLPSMLFGAAAVNGQVTFG